MQAQKSEKILAKNNKIPAYQYYHYMAVKTIICFFVLHFMFLLLYGNAQLFSIIKYHH